MQGMGWDGVLMVRKMSLREDDLKQDMDDQITGSISQYYSCFFNIYM